VGIIAGTIGGMLQLILLSPPTSLLGLEEFQQRVMRVNLIITIPVSIFLLLPFGIKRAHDIGHKGTFLFMLIVFGLIAQLLGCVSIGIFTILCYILGIPALIYSCILLFKDSQPGTNAYGPSTKYPDTAA